MKENEHRRRWTTPLELGSCETDSAVPYSVFFFMLFGGGGAFFPYVNLYFKQLGLSAAQAGVLTGLRHFSELMMAGWGWIADKYKKRRAILQLAILSFAASSLVALAVQPTHQRCEAVSDRDSDVSGTHSTPLQFSPSGVALEDAQFIYATVNFTTGTGGVMLRRKTDQKELNYMFIIILMLTALGQVVGCVIFSMPETLLVAFLEEKVDNFGKVRLWGEVSLAISSFAVGAGINATEMHVCGQVFKNYFIAFYCFAGFMVAAFVASFWLKEKYAQTRPTSLKELAKHGTTLKTIAILLATAFLGMFTGMSENFGLWFVDDLGGSSLLVGVAAGTRYVASLAGYTSSPYFISHFGELRVLVVTLASYAVVFTAISLMRTAWGALAFYVLEGALHSLSWSSIVAYGGRVALEIGSLATIQGILSGLYWGLGEGLGTMVSGLLIEFIGIRTSFQSYAGLAATLSAALVVVYCAKAKDKTAHADVEYEPLPAKVTPARGKTP